PDLLAASEVHGRRPKLMIRVAVREVFLHCGKAVKRSQLWGHEYRIERASFPTLAQMTADQIGSPDRLDEIAAKVTENYVTRMYYPGSCITQRFFTSGTYRTRHRSVRLDRCERTRYATR